MNNFLSKIKSFFKNSFRSDGSYEKKGISPASDWSVILFSATIITLILIGVAIFFYFEIDKNRIFTVDDSSIEAETKINTALLKKVVDEINDRQIRFDELKSGKNIPGDPSL